MRMYFRNLGQASAYYKICRNILEESSSGPDGARLGRWQIRNAIYRGFGFRNFNEFEKIFVPDQRAIAWCHSDEQLKEVFSRALGESIDIARARGFQFHESLEELVKLAIAQAQEGNLAALQAVIARLRPE
jgi:hypothetical protein